MPIFMSSEEYEQCSHDASIVGEKADAFIRELTNQLDTVKAQAEAASIAADQKYLDLAALRSQILQLNSTLEKRDSDIAQLRAQNQQIQVSSVAKDGETERLTTETEELQKSKRQLMESLEQKDSDINENSETVENKIVYLADIAASKEEFISDLKTELTQSQSSHARISQGEKQLNETSSSLKWNKDGVAELESKLASFEKELMLAKHAVATSGKLHSSETSTFQLAAGESQNPEFYEREPQPLLINQQQPIAGGTVRGSTLIGGETDINNRNNENYDCHYRSSSITDYDLTDAVKHVQPQIATENFGVEACNTSARVEVTSDAMEIEPSKVGPADFEGGQALRNQREEHLFTSPNPTTKQGFSDGTPKTLSKAENLREPYGPRKGRDITFEQLQRDFGKSGEETLEALKVKPKVFKHIRGHFKIDDWHHTRDNWKDRQDEKMKAEAVLKGKSVAAEGDNKDGSYNMTVMGTYGNKSAMFEFCSDKGLKKLRKEFADRFRLKMRSFVIKYQYKHMDVEKWIEILVDGDLQFRMKTLRSSGQTIMDLMIEVADNNGSDD